MENLTNKKGTETLNLIVKIIVLVILLLAAGALWLALSGQGETLLNVISNLV